jgi:hypothetical protein
MDNAIARRPLGAGFSAAAAATAIALTVSTTASPPAPVPDVSVPHISTQAVALAASPWDFAVSPVDQVWFLATGLDPAYPLPIPSTPIAPVAEQLVRNLVGYAGQLVVGEAAQIPGLIAVRAENVRTVLQTIPSYLSDNVTHIPFFIMSGALLGAGRGAVAGGLVGQNLFPDAAPGTPPAVVQFVTAAIGGTAGSAIGAVQGLVSVPLYWTANLLKFRNSLAVALASTVPHPASEPQLAAAAVRSIDPKPDDNAVEPGVSMQRTTSEAPTAEGAVDNESAVRDTIADVPEVLQSPQQQAVTPAGVSTDPEPTAGLVEPEPDRTRTAPMRPKLRGWAKHPSAVQPATDENVSLAAKPASDKTVPGRSKRSERRATAASGATQTKSGVTEERRSDEKAVSKPSA